jgi:anti-sigma regulatory factor (Ser/Thr protein kinase)
MSDPSSNEPDEFLELLVPLRTRYAATVRVLAASLGADAGFSVDEIDDLRLGLDEVFSLLVEHDGSSVARVRFRLDGAELTVRVSADHPPVGVEPDELAANILRTVVDRCTFAPDAITLVKRATEAV